MHTFEMEVTIEVEYDVEPGQIGCKDSMGCPEEPSWEPYVDDVRYKVITDISEIRKEAEINLEELMEEE